MVSWSVGDIRFGGTSLNHAAQSLLRPLTATDTTKSLGPLRFADVTPTLNDFSFTGGVLSFNVGLSASLAGLSFGGSGTGDSSGTNSGGVTSQFKTLSGSFGLSVTVDPSSFRVTSVSGTGKFTLTAQEFDFSVANAVTGTFNGINVNYDPKLDSSQTIVSIDSGHVTSPPLPT